MLKLFQYCGHLMLRTHHLKDPKQVGLEAIYRRETTEIIDKLNTSLDSMQTEPINPGKAETRVAWRKQSIIEEST